jgi:hypothetical protein
MQNVLGVDRQQRGCATEQHGEEVDEIAKDDRLSRM